MVQGGQLRVIEGGREPGATGPGTGQEPDEEKAAAAPLALPVIPPRSLAALWLIPAAFFSLILHGGLLVLALRAPQLISEREDSIVQMFVVETPPEVEEIKEVEPEPEEPEPEPEPEPEVVDYQDAVVAEAPPPDAKPAEEQPAAPVFGVSMSSTVSGGSSWGLQVGNTVAINPEDSATVDDPSDLDTPVVAYQFIEREPVVIKRHEPPYPDGPKQAGIEGDVLLYLTIDADGNVTSAKVVRGPHPELNEAARKAMFKHRFRPAMKGGKPVIVERFPYQFTWIIEE